MQILHLWYTNVEYLPLNKSPWFLLCPYHRSSYSVKYVDSVCVYINFCRHYTNWSEKNPILHVYHWFQKPKTCVHSWFLESMVKLVQWDFSLITNILVVQYSHHSKDNYYWNRTVEYVPRTSIPKLHSHLLSPNWRLSCFVSPAGSWRQPFVKFHVNWWNWPNCGNHKFTTHLIVVRFTSNFVHLHPLSRLPKCVSRFGMTWNFSF